MIPTPFPAPWPSGLRRLTLAPFFFRLPPESNRLSLGTRYSSAPILCQEVLPPLPSPHRKSDCRTVSIPHKSPCSPPAITPLCDRQPATSRLARSSRAPSFL